MLSLLGLCPKVLKTVEIGYTAGTAGIEIHDAQDLEQKIRGLHAILQPESG
jgi:hypothetical protein